MTPVRTVLTYCIVAVLGGVAVMLYLWRTGRIDPPPVYRNVPGATQYVPVPKKIVTVEKITVPGPERVVLVPSAIVSEKMRWPEIAQDNILAIGAVPPHRGTTSVVAVADFKDNTLSARLVMRQEPQSFFELKREFSVYGGWATGGILAGVSFRPLRVGPVDIVGRGEVVAGSDTKVTGAVLAEWRF